MEDPPLADTDVDAVGIVNTSCLANCSAGACVVFRAGLMLPEGLRVSLRSRLLSIRRSISSLLGKELP